MVLVLPTICAALLADSLLLDASCRTSSATTAKPFPALPARAASTDALSARMPVWNAISSISFAILVIFRVLPLISSMAWESASIRAFASWMHWEISSVFLRV